MKIVAELHSYLYTNLLMDMEKSIMIGLININKNKRNIQIRLCIRRYLL